VCGVAVDCGVCAGGGSCVQHSCSCGLPPAEPASSDSGAGGAPNHHAPSLTSGGGIPIPDGVGGSVICPQ
jgi:hypothetical protein